MAVKRFLLDTSTLDDSETGLDGGLAFILDTSTLDSDRVLDGGIFLTTGTGEATLGALTASATATVTIVASAESTLGSASASATGTVTIVATGSSDFGELSTTSEAIVTRVATADASLGGVSASATATVTFIAVGSADLGGASSSATGDVTPQPSPEPDTGGGGRQYYARPRRIKKETVVEVADPKVEPKRVVGLASVGLGGVVATASAATTFSIADDDAELLLML